MITLHAIRTGNLGQSTWDDEVLASFTIGESYSDTARELALDNRVGDAGVVAVERDEQFCPVRINWGLGWVEA